MRYTQSSFQIGDTEAERSHDAEIYEVEGKPGPALEVSYTVVLHARNADLFFPNVVPWDRYPDTVHIQPTKPGTPVTVMYCGNILKFQFEEKLLPAECP
jgi:hypothetical protein